MSDTTQVIQQKEIFFLLQIVCWRFIATWSQALRIRSSWLSNLVLTVLLPSTGFDAWVGLLFPFYLYSLFTCLHWGPVWLLAASIRLRFVGPVKLILNLSLLFKSRLSMSLDPTWQSFSDLRHPHSFTSFNPSELILHYSWFSSNAYFDTELPVNVYML